MQREVTAEGALFRRSSTAGALMIVVALGQMLAFQPRSCGGLPRAYDTVVAFELARTHIDLMTIFGSGASECRQALISSLSALAWVDTILFVPVYACFSWSFMRAHRASSERLARPAAHLVIVAACADWIENACLLALMPELSENSAAFAILPWATGVKWLSLGLGNAAGGLLVWHGSARGLRGLLALVIGPLSLVLTLAAIATPARFGPLLVPAVSAGWLLFLIVGAARSVQQRALA
jgi:hypothetical protein